MCLECGCGSEHVHVDGQAHQHTHRRVSVGIDLLAENNRYAAANRQYLADKNILALNLLSGPGSGKTTLLTRSIADLKDALVMAVIEGDQQTSNDAERIRATGIQAIQINTGKGCHLDAHMVGHGLEKLQPQDNSVLFIENVGNLVCPASFDLGEARKVVILSVTEGDDKPLKYPDMFHAADLMIINKIDLLPYVEFDVHACIAAARRVNPEIEILQLSATRGEGLEQWYAWINSQRDATTPSPWKGEGRDGGDVESFTPTLALPLKGEGIKTSKDT